MASSAPAPTTLRLFQIQNGLVISESGQQDADDFAADYQGLRHFSERVSQVLDLGDSLYASLHEPDFTFMYLQPQDAGAQPSRASGAMISQNVSNAELLVGLRQRNQ